MSADAWLHHYRRVPSGGRYTQADLQYVDALYERAPVDFVRNEGPFVSIEVK